MTPRFSREQLILLLLLAAVILGRPEGADLTSTPVLGDTATVILQKKH